MKNFLTVKHSIFAGALLGGSLILTSTFIPVLGQAAKSQADQPDKREQKVKGPRDPFVKYRPPAPVNRQIAGRIQPPSIQERIDLYKSLKAASMAAQQPAPKPTTALLISELQVVGIFKTPRGYAAMVEATPIKLSYVVYPGEQFYDGQLVAIEEERLILRRETRLSNGKKEFAVENKPLRKPNPIVDSMAATKETSSGSTVASAGENSAQPAQSEQKANQQ